MASHINDHAPEGALHKAIAQTHAKLDALAEGQKVLSEQIAALFAKLKPDAAQDQRSDKQSDAGGGQ